MDADDISRDIHEDEVPDAVLVAFHVNKRDVLDGKRTRQYLAGSAPPGARLNLEQLPIVASGAVPRHHMYAVDEEGTRVFNINMETGVIKTV